MERVAWTTACVLAAGMGFHIARIGGAAAGAALVALIWMVNNSIRDRRERRRARLLAQPFPPDWRAFLEERCDHYARLPEDWRPRFERALFIFIQEKRMTGVDLMLTDELRLLVAASAVTLSIGWPSYEWPQLAEVLVYPQDFDRDYSFEHDDLSGQAHPWGTLILSAPSLIESFADPDDGYHVGLHEFAHLLDAEGARFDGIPPGLPEQQCRKWVELRDREMERLRRGKSALDDYGAHEVEEFFAVAVESFFEMSLEVRRRHRELYAMLAEYFQQDPAAWDDARGLELS